MTSVRPKLREVWVDLADTASLPTPTWVLHFRLSNGAEVVVLLPEGADFEPAALRLRNAGGDLMREGLRAVEGERERITAKHRAVGRR